MSNRATPQRSTPATSLVRSGRPPTPGALVPRRITPHPGGPAPRLDLSPPASPVTGGRLARVPLLVLAAVAVCLHVAASWVSVYGLHRDELLYLAMGRHLRLLSMDFPPAIAMLAEATRALFGETDVAIRLGPALAHAALVGMAGVLAHELRGRTGAQLVAAGCVLASPLFLRAGNLFQPVVFDQLWWTLALYALVRIGRAAEETIPVVDARGLARTAPAPGLDLVWTAPEGRRRRMPWRVRAGAWLAHATASPWLVLGVAAGLGLLTKFSIVFLGVGVLVALAVGPLRATLRTPRPWLVLALALALGAPSVIGQLRLDWPVVGQMQALRSSQLVHVGVLEFLGGQLLLGPAVVLAAVGAWTLLTAHWARAGRTAGIACVVTFALLLVLRGKAYYVAPIYPLLFAAGAVALEHGPWGRRARPRRGTRISLGIAGAAVAAYGLVTLPLGLPVLPPAETARWITALGAGDAALTNTGERLEIPQDYADMLGWPELAAAVGEAFAALPAATRADAAVLAANYGQAGALDFYGPRVGLPTVVSPAGSYWFFGAGDRVGDPILTVGVPVAGLRARCTRVVLLRQVRHELTRWMVPEERDVPLALCEGPRQSLRSAWPSLAGQN